MEIQFIRKNFTWKILFFLRINQDPPLSGADPGFWSEGPPEFWQQWMGHWTQNLIQIFGARGGGSGGLGPPVDSLVSMHGRFGNLPSAVVMMEACLYRMSAKRDGSSVFFSSRALQTQYERVEYFVPQRTSSNVATAFCTISIYCFAGHFHSHFSGLWAM